MKRKGLQFLPVKLIMHFLFGQVLYTGVLDWGESLSQSVVVLMMRPDFSAERPMGITVYRSMIKLTLFNDCMS